MNRRAIVAFIVAAFVPTAAWARDVLSESQCYDLKVKARIVEQIPSVVPECTDCVLMSWPWFIDLQVNRVLEGKAPGKTIRALSIQHTYLASRDAGMWLLRRNTAGTFNIVYRDDEAQPPHCSRSVAGAKPYLTSESKNLDQLRQEGERRYGRHPS